MYVTAKQSIIYQFELSLGQNYYLHIFSYACQPALVTATRTIYHYNSTMCDPICFNTMYKTAHHKNGLQWWTMRVPKSLHEYPIASSNPLVCGEGSGHHLCVCFNHCGRNVIMDFSMLPIYVILILDITVITRT